MPPWPGSGEITTNPIQKAGCTTPASAGYTEYLGERAGLGAPPVMLLASPNLKVVPVTIHLFEGRNWGADDRGNRAHAGNYYQFAHSIMASPILDQRYRALTPMQARVATWVERKSTLSAPPSTGFQADAEIRGPLAGDTMFHEAARRTYDVAVCMYHDRRSSR